MSKLLIKDGKTLAKLTGSWYENSLFSRIETDLENETFELGKVIGQNIIDHALTVLENSTPDDTEKETLRLIQVSVGLMAVYRYFQSNLVSHEGNGRKMKIDSQNEKMAWEWMIERDDNSHLLKAQRAQDRLIEHLEKNNVESFNDSEERKDLKSLFLNNTRKFEYYFPIDLSGRFYHGVSPLIREIQDTYIADAFEEDYLPFLARFQKDELNEADKLLIGFVCRAEALYTIALACRRFSLTVLPQTVVKKIKAAIQTTEATKEAAAKEIDRYIYELEKDACEHLNKLKRQRYKSSPEYTQRTLLPKNDPRQKFART